METNQDKVKALIGMESYMKLAHAGYIAIEIDTLEVLLAHNEQLRKVEESLRQLEFLHDIGVQNPKTSTPSAQMPDIDNDVTATPKVIPADYKWSEDTAFQLLEDEVKSLNTFGIPLYINPTSTSGSGMEREGELSVVFLAKGNSEFIKLLKEHHWTIHRWRVNDNYPSTNKVVQINAKKYVKLHFEMGYKAKLEDIYLHGRI